MRHAGRSAFIAGGLILLVVGFAPAQSRTTGSSGSSGGGFTGSSSSGGGFTGSSSGSSGGSFTGSSSGSSGGSFLGSSSGSSGSMTGTSSGTNSVGSTSAFGRFYGNPITSRLTPQTSASGQFSITTSVYPTSYAAGFGNPSIGTATVTQSRTTGQTSLGTGTAAFAGATSAGIRRAPGYVTEPAFDLPARPTLTAMQPELQGVISRATRLPSRERIRVAADGDTVVLRGQVRDERERRLAEAMIRLSPGVRLVRNELEPLNRPPPK